MRALVLPAILAATPVLADTWQSTGFDDGVWFIGSAVAPYSAFLFQCGGRSGQQFPFEQSDLTEPKLTRDNDIMISVDPSLFDTTEDVISNISVVIDGSPFLLPSLRFNEFDGFFEAPLDINDPIFARLRSGTFAGILWRGEWIARDIPLTGSSDAIQTMAQACVAGWAAQPRIPPNWTASTIAAEARRYCNGPATVNTEFVIAEDVDTDDIPDLILDMREIECTEGESWQRRGAGMCGASQCSIFVYLSTNPSAEPDEILGLGAQLRTGEGGQTLIAAGAAYSTCLEANLETCEYRFDPSGGTLDYLGLFPYPD